MVDSYGTWLESTFSEVRRAVVGHQYRIEAKCRRCCRIVQVFAQMDVPGSDVVFRQRAEIQLWAFYEHHHNRASGKCSEHGRMMFCTKCGNVEIPFEGLCMICYDAALGYSFR